MSYNIKYTVPFKSINDVPCIIEILEDGFTGVATELIGGVSPFKIKLDDGDFLYTPLRFSSATIKLVGGDYMQSLFSTNYQQFKVIFKRNNVIKWIGFIKPEVYTQDYSVEPFELEIQCQSALSVLEFIDYKKAGDEITFVSLFDLITRSILESKGSYQNVYIPHVYARDSDTYNSLDNVLSEMKVSEQNFFDEESEPMKFKDVLEEVCKLLNWTCHVWNDSVYFIDINHTGQYYKFNSDLSSSELVNLLNTAGVQEVGFAGSDHSLDILGGYNKVKVKTSNYTVGEIFPKETFNAVVTMRARGQFYPEPINVTPGIRGDTMVYLSQAPNVYRTHRYKVASDSGSSVRNLYLGSSLCRICLYAIESQPDGSYRANITEFSYDNCVCIRTKEKQYTSRVSYNIVSLSSGKEVLSFIPSLPCSVYSDGAFCISGMVAQSNQIENHAFSSNIGSTSELKLICKLQVGNMYWNGSNWVTTDSVFKVLVTPKGTGYAAINNTKELGMPYTGLDGYLIQLPDNPIAGSVKFTMYTPEYADDVVAVYIKDFKLNYKKKDGGGKEDSNSDRCYENVVNESFITDLDEIEFKISSYNNDGACYGKVLLGDKYLTDNLYSIIAGKQIRLEEHLIRRIINQYQATKIKLTQILKYTESITPATMITDTYMGNRKFIMTGGEIDFEQEEFNCIMTEFNGNYKE